MILVKPSFLIENITPNGLELIERAGRTCYKSESKITSETAIPFVKMIMKSGHESVIEHSSMTVRLICDRGVTHELVRHRLCAFSQESTRWCNYKGGATFVIPPWVTIEPGEYETGPCRAESFYFDNFADGQWFSVMYDAEKRYKILIESGWTTHQARSVLPNSLKTEIVVTANFREWRHIFKLRTGESAHPQMRELMIPLLAEVKERVPVIFDDIIV